MIDVKRVSGIGGYAEKEWKNGDETAKVYVAEENEKAFLVERAKTIEVRCDRKLGQKLREEYESVMESRYFGRGGIEIVECGQLSEEEVADLVRLSYNMTIDNE